MKIWFAPAAEYLSKMVGVFSVVGAMNEVELFLLAVGSGLALGFWLQKHLY